MKEPITTYSLATGEFLGGMSIGSGLWAVPDGEGWKPGRHDPTQVRVDLVTDEIVPLMTMVIAVETNRITGIPPGTWALVDFERLPGTISDGELELEVPFPHTALVTLQCPLHFPLPDIEVPCEA